MAFIGYNESGYNELASAISSRHSNLKNLLERFDTEIIPGIKAAWKGPDADNYVSQLQNVVSQTKERVDSLYGTMSSQFETTYNEWKTKQSN